MEIKVDYQKMANVATTVATKGKTINEELTEVYNDIDELHAPWYGQRYNNLVMTYNDFVTEINTILKLLVEDIPKALKTISFNYDKTNVSPQTNNQKVESNKSTSSEEEISYTPIQELAIPSDVGMRFILSEVEQKKGIVQANLKDVINIIDEIYTECTSIEWESEVATEFNSKINTICNNSKEIIEDMETVFCNYIDNSKQDIQGAESANTIV